MPERTVRPTPGTVTSAAVVKLASGLLLPDQPDLAAYLADFMPEGLTGRIA